MRFLRRNQYLLCTVAVLVLASVMVLRQFMSNETAHIQRREDFLLLHERGQTVPCVQFYERLIQELPALSDRLLVDDLQRTTLLLDSNQSNVDNPVWKYNVSLKRELQQRAHKRLQVLGLEQQP
jgi:hypothetical protein